MHINHVNILWEKFNSRNWKIIVNHSDLSQKTKFKTKNLSKNNQQINKIAYYSVQNLKQKQNKKIQKNITGNQIIYVKLEYYIN